MSLFLGKKKDDGGGGWILKTAVSSQTVTQYLDM